MAGRTRVVDIGNKRSCRQPPNLPRPGEATHTRPLGSLAGSGGSSVAQFDRFEDFEEHIVDYLATVSDLDVFGSELDFINPITQEFLQDQIWDALHANKNLTLVVRECVEIFQSKNKMEPTNPNANTFKKLHMSK